MSKQRVTVSLGDEHLKALADFKDAHGVESRSEAVRLLLDEYEALQRDYEELNTAYEELETEAERLKREKRLILEERDEKQELIRFVEEERTAEQRWREAGLATRIRWKLFGMDPDE